MPDVSGRSLRRCSRRPNCPTFFKFVLPRLLCAFIGFVVFRPGCLPGQPGLSHQSPNVTGTVLYIERIDEILPSKWNRPRGRISTNPAAQNMATEELPGDSNRPDRQFWKERDRNALLAFVDKRVDESFDDDSTVSQARLSRSSFRKICDQGAIFDDIESNSTDHK